MAEADLFTLGRDSNGNRIKAQDTYERLAAKRQNMVDMARDMAELTIPTIMPPDGYQTGDPLPGNNQSIGAQGVSNLASALMFMAFPPGQPIVRMEAVEYMIQAEVDEDPELWSNTALALSRLELTHRKRLQTTTISDTYTRYMELLLVGGNALWKHLQLSEPTYHRPDCYAVKRSATGQALLIIHEETVSLQTMDEDHQDFIMANASEDTFKDMEEWEKTVRVYSVCKLKVDADGEKTWLYWQEWEDHTLPDTEVETDFDTPPMHAGWLIAVPGQDWGPSYCERYRGDLYIVEAAASGLNDGASLAALSLLFVRPGVTNIKQIREARNLSVLAGDAADVSVFRSEKTPDMNFVMGHLEAAERRLDRAFLRQISVQRNAERVTAEEVKRVGRELDKAMGGLYTQVAQGNQRPIIMRVMRLHEEENENLPELPQDIVNVQVVTGIDALGQSTEYDNLKEYAADGIAAFPRDFERVHSATDFFNRAAAAKGIKPDGLVKKPEQLAQEDQQAQQQALLSQAVDKGTGPAVKGIADAMANQQQPPTITQ